MQNCGVTNKAKGRNQIIYFMNAKYIIYDICRQVCYPPILSTVYHDLDIQLVYVFYKLSIHSLSAVYHDLDPLATLGHFERLQSLLQSVAMRNERLHVNLTARQHLNHRGPPTIIIIITELSFITLLLLSSSQLSS